MKDDEGGHPFHDTKMPDGWHQIKCAWLAEAMAAGTYDLCRKAANAIMHARLIGESISRERVLHHSETDGRAPE